MSCFLKSIEKRTNKPLKRWKNNNDKNRNKCNSKKKMMHNKENKVK